MPKKASMTKKTSRRRNAQSEVDRLLAAPEEVTNSPREKQKLLDRKARDAAREARVQAGKSKREPSIEDVLGDLVRVAEDEATNPFHEFRALSKRRYELYGHYPINSVTRMFGQFEHAKQAAGLATPEGDRRFAIARTQQSKREHDARYMRRWILPHVDKFPELSRATSKVRCGLSISDTHSAFLDPFTWDVFLDAAEDLQPDVLVFNGDIIDGSEITSHPKVPGYTVPLQYEIDIARAMFAEARRRSPRSKLLWVAGNHFLDRMVRYLTQSSPEIAGLRTLRLDRMLELDGLDVDLVQGGTFISPPGSEDQRPFRRLWDSFIVTHGTRLGSTPARDELRQWGCSGTSGHVHRAQLVHGETFTTRNLSWVCTPSACTDEAARYYIKGPGPAWQRGFGFFQVANGVVRQYPVITSGGGAILEGRVWQDRGKYPQGGQELRRYWARRFSLESASQ